MSQSNYNKHLERQIRRKLGKDTPIPEEFRSLLDSINQTYIQHERDRAMLERAMQISSEELRNSYGKLAIQKEIESKNEQLEQFVHSASHDLKAPLHTITSFSNLLSRELSNLDVPDTIHQYLKFILGATEGVNTLISNLLEYARVGSNSTETEDVDLNKVLAAVKRNLHSILEDNNGELLIDSLPNIKAVPHHMLQLFQNLIGNAIKFKKKEVNPVVKVSYKEEKERFVFSIADNGIGMTEKGKEKIFQAFQRLNNAKDFKGSGLGLSICKTIIEKMEGKIWVESEEGVGSTFFIAIPKNRTNLKAIIKDSNRNSTANMQ